MSNKLHESIIATIKSNNIAPTARWRFTVRNYGLWILAGIATLSGGYSVAGILYSITHFDFEYWDYVYASATGTLSHILSPIWLGSLILLAIIAIYAIRTTNRGYRFQPWMLVLISIMISIVIGIGIYIVSITGTNPTYYAQNIQHRNDQVWHQPTAGRIIGIVIDHDETAAFVSDITMHTWAIDTEYLLPRSRIMIESGQRVRIIGIPTSENTFTACAVLPHRGGPTYGNRVQMDIQAVPTASIHELCEILQITSERKQ